MQEMQLSDKNGEQPKRSFKYKRMSEGRKRDLVFRVLYLGENLRTVCSELGFNHSTGKNLLQRYKKTGEYVSHKEVYAPAYYSNFTRGILTRESESKARSCPLGILLLSEDNLQIVSAKAYTEKEEISLIELHNEFVRRGIV
eukprot:TRINITY_DN7744_c0_g1_i22.p1 TRINITY_DN7744_c0_g1~~TRINITY_DN7744_c0_g1_i22.p1  ORF type:complete len:142 (+),score=22.80 TRINITY_DN7744_c0_g1_i22:174-599(+)